jgi:outer membrane protein assembly factor BamA/autotransporter translocation and assembly factor TamB
VGQWDSDESPRPRSRRHRALRGLGIVGLALCALVIVALIAVHTPPARRFITGQIVALLAREQIEFSTDQLSFNALNASVNLRNVRIRSTAWPEAPTFATIDRLQVNMGLLQLLRGRYVVQSGDVSGLDVHYFVDEQGRDNLPRPPRNPDESTEPLDYLVSALSIRDTTVRYENRVQQVDARLPVATIEVNGNNLTDRHEITLEAANGQVQVQDRQATIDRLIGQFDLGVDDVSFEQLDVVAEGSRAEVIGSIRQFEAPIADVAVTSALDATHLAPLAKLAEPMSGVVSVNASAKGPLSTPAINAHVTSSALQFRDLRDVQLDATASYDVATRRADVSALQVRGPWGGVAANGNVALDGSQQSNLQADIDSLDVGAIMRALRLPYVAATRVDGTLQAEWPGFDYLSAKGTANATLRPTASNMSPSAMPLGGRLTARGDGNRIDTQLARITVPGAEVNGRFAVTSQRQLQGQITAHSDDVGRLASSVEAFTGRPAGSLLPTPVSGALDVNARIGGSVSAPTAVTSLNAPSLSVGSAEGIALAADASYGEDTVTIPRADVTWQQARAHADGSLGLRPGQPIRLSFTADSLEIQALLQALNKSDVPVSGVLAARGTVGGTMGRPTAMVTAEGTNLVAYQEPIGVLKANLQLDGPQLTLSQLVVDKPQLNQPGQLIATGTYNLDGRNYTFDLKSKGLRLVGLRLSDDKRIRGDVQQLTASGQGIISSPTGTLDLEIDALEIVDAHAASTVATNGESESAGANEPAQPVAPIVLGRVTLSAVAHDNEAMIKATAERFNVNADAVIGLGEAFPATVKLRAEDLDLAALPIEASPRPEGMAPGLQGQLRATVDASGNLAEPEKGQVTVALDALNASWNGRPFTVTSPSPIRYADQRVNVEKLAVTADDVSLTLSGGLPLTEEAGAGEIAVDLHGSLATLMLYAPPQTDIASDGTVALTGSLRGTLEHIDPELMLTIDNGLVLSPRLEPGFSGIVLRARIDDGEADIEQLAASWGTARIEASGRVPLELLPQLPVEIPRMSGPAMLKAALTGLDPSAIPGAPPQLSGRVSAQAELSATEANAAAIDGRVMFQELDVAFNGLDLEQQQPSTIAIADGAATVEQLHLSGSAGDVTASGRVGFVGDRSLDVNVDGNFKLAAVSIVTDRVRAEGDSTLKLLARGTLSAPNITGSLDVVNATLISDEPNIATQNLNARVDLEGRRIALTRLEAAVNGGMLNGQGSVTLGEGLVSDVDLDITTTDFAYDAPLDLRSVSDATIKVTKDGEDILVSGQVTIDEAGLTGDINFDTGLLAAMTARRSLDLTEERNPLLERIRFDVDVNTATPVLVDNNLARAEIEADLNVVGTPYETGLLGKLNVLEGSEIRLNERRYETEQGIITFADERRIFPDFDLRLNTTAGNYDITIAVIGTPGETETTLTSSPALPEPDIMAMLVTGRTLDDMRGEEYEVAREQVLSYLAGRVGSTLGRGLQEATGFSEVRIEPTLIANEADPSARLTVGQEVTDELKLVYSTNLTDSNDQIWVAEYDVTRRFQTRGVRQGDNSYRLDFRHDVRFGGEPEPRRIPRIQAKVAEVAVSVPPGSDEAAVRKAFGVEVDDNYDFFAVRNGMERVEELFMDQGHLQARAQLDRRVEGEQAYLTLKVAPGLRVDIEFAGAMPPPEVRDEVRTRWHRGVFDKQRADDGVDALREWLMSDNYLQARIDYQIEDVADGRRRVVFQIQPGERSQRVVLAFEGASAIDPDDLNKIIEDQQLERRLFTDPLVVTELLERYYRERGHLSAEIDEPRYEYQNADARVVLPVREGPRFTVARVTLSGNSVYTSDALLSQLPVVAGEPYAPAAAENALDTIRDLYWDKGYNDVRSDYDLVINRGTGEVSVAFMINEGPENVIAGITIQGNREVSNRLIRRQIQLAEAQPLDLSALARSRRNLYETGAFSVVDITREDVKSGEAPAAGAAESNNSDAARASQAAAGEPAQGLNSTAPSPADEPFAASPPAHATEQKPVNIIVQIREMQPFQIRYGASYDTERGVGGIFDIANFNSLGGAREIGLRSRYDRQLREGRFYINQPALTYLPRTTGNVYFREELNPPTELTDSFDTTRKGASIQQELELRGAYVWSYGYRWERAHRLTPLADGIILDESVTVSPLTSTLTRETRDEVLDASRGAFLSQAFSYSPSWLGSDQAFIKYFGQYFKYFPLRAPERKPFTNEMIRPRLVYAAGVRLGLAHGIGGRVPNTERFFAGGSATLRGFAQNAVGPIGLNRIPIGGEAMLVINNELRAPLIGIIDGVVFSDIGNVFQTIRDFSFTDLRKSVGIGLRVRTPWVLLRGDYGVVLDRQPGEARGRFYFSIGQAF